MRIHIPNSARLQNIEGFLRQFDPADDSRLAFTMHDRWIAAHPAVLAFTAAVADYVSRCGGSHDGKVEQIKSLPYLIRMKLFDHLKLEYGEAITEHEEAGRFIPLQRISTTEDLSSFIINMIPLLHADRRHVEPIRYVISELVRNVLEHAGSPGGALVCAQYYRNTRVLALGVADAGVGVRETIARFHSAPTDWDALLLALRPGVTGTTSRIGGTAYNAGAGLFFTKSIACASRNYFVLYSGEALFKLKPLPRRRKLLLYADPGSDHHTKVIALPRWRGTLVGIDVSIDEQGVFADLMDLIRQAFRVDVREQKRQRYKRPRFM